MSMVKVKTAELTGQALDWAVAKAVGLITGKSGGVYTMPTLPDGEGRRPVFIDSEEIYSPSTDWSQGGPLRDEFNVGIEPGSASDGRRYAYVPGRELDGSFGETALIAICRAIVAAKLGDEVEVPQELVG